MASSNPSPLQVIATQSQTPPQPSPLLSKEALKDYNAKNRIIQQEAHAQQISVQNLTPRRVTTAMSKPPTAGGVIPNTFGSKEAKDSKQTRVSSTLKERMMSNDFKNMQAQKQNTLALSRQKSASSLGFSSAKQQRVNLKAKVSLDTSPRIFQPDDSEMIPSNKVSPQNAFENNKKKSQPDNKSFQNRKRTTSFRSVNNLIASNSNQNLQGKLATQNVQKKKSTSIRLSKQPSNKDVQGYYTMADNRQVKSPKIESAKKPLDFSARKSNEIMADFLENNDADSNKPVYKSPKITSPKFQSKELKSRQQLPGFRTTTPRDLQKSSLNLTQTYNQQNLTYNTKKQRKDKNKSVLINKNNKSLSRADLLLPKKNSHMVSPWSHNSRAQKLAKNFATSAKRHETESQYDQMSEPVMNVVPSLCHDKKHATTSRRAEQDNDNYDYDSADFSEQDESEISYKNNIHNNGDYNTFGSTKTNPLALEDQFSLLDAQRMSHQVQLENTKNLGQPNDLLVVELPSNQGMTSKYYTARRSEGRGSYVAHDYMFGSVAVRPSIGFKKKFMKNLKNEKEPEVILPTNAYDLISEYEPELLHKLFLLNNRLRDQMHTSYQKKLIALAINFNHIYQGFFNLQEAYLVEKKIQKSLDQSTQIQNNDQSRVDCILRFEVLKPCQNRTVELSFLGSRQQSTTYQNVGHIKYKFDCFSEGQPRWLWVHQESRLNHAQSDQSSYSIPIVPVNVADSGEISLTFLSLMGSIDLQSIQWQPIRLQQLPSQHTIKWYNRSEFIAPDRDRKRKYFADLNRVCEVEDAVAEWYPYDSVKYVCQDSLVKHLSREKPEKLWLKFIEKHYFVCSKVDLGGIDFSVWRIQLRAQWNYTNTDWCLKIDELGLSIRNVALKQSENGLTKVQASKLVTEIKRVGVIIDRGAEVQVRGGDLLILYLSMGGYMK